MIRNYCFIFLILFLTPTISMASCIDGDGITQLFDTFIQKRVSDLMVRSDAYSDDLLSRVAGQVVCEEVNPSTVLLTLHSKIHHISYGVGTRPSDSIISALHDANSRALFRQSDINCIGASIRKRHKSTDLWITAIIFSTCR